MGTPDDDLFVEHDSIVGEMPGEIKVLYDGILNPIISELGESPEAWRGAIRLGMEIMKGLSADPELDTREWETARAKFIIILLIGLMKTPWGRNALGTLREANGDRMRSMIDEIFAGLGLEEE